MRKDRLSAKKNQTYRPYVALQYFVVLTAETCCDVSKQTFGALLSPSLIGTNYVIFYI